MSLQQQAEVTDTNVPVNLQVNQNGGVTGLTAVVAVRDGSTANSYLDFNDQTFKTGGWTAQTAALADLGNGVYALAGGLNIATMVGRVGSHLVLEYNVTGSVSGDAIDVILLRNHVYDVAAPGDAMDLVTDAVDAAAVAADAVAEIQSGLAVSAEATRIHGENARTQLSFANAEINTGTRFVPLNAVSHMHVQIKAEAAVDWSAPVEDFYVVFNYKALATSSDGTAASTTQASAPVDGTFTTVDYPS